MIRISDAVVLHEREIDERFVRSSGPGGQNVNKVSTAVQLRVDLASTMLPPEVRRRLETLAGSRMTADGMLVIDAREHRTQAQNREAARARLAALLERAARQPKARRATLPTAGSRERRVAEKRRHSKLKRQRARAENGDE